MNVKHDELVSKILSFAKTYNLPIEVKAGRRLSADSMAKIDELEKCVKELDDAIEACKSARDNMASRIKVLRDGNEPEETEEEPEEDEVSEKGARPTTIKIVG